MITKDNFPQVLNCLGFKKYGKKYRKHYDDANCDIVVDFEKERIEYPSSIDTGANTTTNFTQNENFVVLECVDRLLVKKYKPESIFLEKAWTLGHTGKSGRADITIYDQNNNAYLIIECKRAGKAYKDALKELHEDPSGRQLFSYWAQARSTQWLQLYASDYDEENNIITFKEEIVRSQDDKNVELLAKEDDTILLYKSASTAEDFFIVWDETYSKKVYHNIIFGEDSVAYNIGDQPIKNKDLKKFKKEDGITDTFREILRHNSISDKENAFNKLLSLFICKFVDEERHRDENDIMDFQYIDGTDNYYSLYERLLALFQIGMKEYLKEDVFYLDNDYIRKTLDQFTGKKRKELEEELVDKFQKTKMLSCQVFAFREVYNEKLFLQNGKVLVEVVELFQNYKLAYTSKDQFLGELFENLLDQGFKQEAGQFFTPVPITRFVWNSLPLDRYLTSKVLSLPKVIDFACGSGHFLTEGVSAIADNLDDIDDKTISDSFYGIDKDNRLARVSKVAMLLNGASNAHIKPGDGLEHDEDFLGELHSFDILVANPPYSVDAFKTHESRKVQNTYETIKLMSLDCKDIQNVFIERMHHLLKPKGIAAIVMPSSLLSNTDAADIKTREILFHNFYIRCIASFGGQTFGKTSTNTIILFLEHFDFPPERAKLMKDSARAIVNGENLDDWSDSDLFNEYLKTIDTQKESYLQFVSKTESLFENSFASYFKEYETAYKKQPNTTKALEKIAETERKEEEKHPLKKNEKSSEEQKAVLNNDFYEWVKKTEENKILIFALTYKQQTLIITAPSETNEQKKFLGYSNSERRRKEGLEETGGLLTNITNRTDKQKLAWLVRKIFDGEQCNTEELRKYAKYVQVSDMINYRKQSFELQIKLSVNNNTTSASNWPQERLGDTLVKVQGPQTKIPKEKIQKTGNVPVVTQESGTEISGYTENVKPITDLPLIVFGDHSCSFKYVDFNFVRGADGTQLIKVNNDYILKYVFEYLCTIKVDNRGKYERHFKYLKDVMIPKPPMDIQQKIVAECELLNKEYDNNKEDIEKYNKKILETIAGIKGDVEKIGKLCKINEESIDPTKTPEKEYIYVDIESIKNGEGVFSTENKIIGGNAPSRARRIAKANSTIISTVRPNLKGFAFIENEIKDSVFSTGFAILKSKNTEKLLDKMIYLMFMYSEHLMKQMTGAMPKGQYPSINKSDIEAFTIPVPSLLEQQRIVAQITTYEKKINNARSVMVSIAAKKSAVLEKWL